MSPGVSSWLSKQMNGRENIAICLKWKLRRSIGFSLQLCFHTAAEAGRLALLNETLACPIPPTSVSVLGSRVLSLRWYGSAGMSMCAGTWFSSMPRPQSTAVSFVIVDFRRCHGFAVGWEWGGAAPEGLIFPTAALYWIIPHSLVQLSRGGVKQLTCDMSPQSPSSGKESYCPSAVKVFIFLLLPRAIWAEGRKQYCLNTSCSFGWNPLVPAKDTNLVFPHVWTEKQIPLHCPLLNCVPHNETIFSGFFFIGHEIFYSICLLKAHPLDRAPIVFRSWNSDLVVLTMLASPYGDFMYFDTWWNVQ